MKHLLILITLILALATSTVAQITTTLSEGSYYYVVVAGDTISQHNRLDKAIESASDATMMGGDWEIVQNYRLRGTSYFYDEDIIIEEVIDTVYITEIVRDTIYVSDGEPIELAPVESFRTNIEYRPEDSLTVVHSYAYTNSDSLRINFDCDTAREPLYRQVSTHSASNEYEIIYDAIGTRCNTDLILEYLFYKDGVVVEQKEDIYPFWSITEEQEGTAFYTAFENTAVMPWENIWGTLAFSVEDATLIVDLLDQNIARLQWTSVPEHRNIEYRVRETLHASHSTGAHIGGRHSLDDTAKNSVETYIHSEGLGVSVFNNDTWSNPHNFPFEWASGDTIEYRVRIIDDTISAKVWNVNNTEPEQWSSFSSPTIESTSSGYFAIGSTGAGLYIIHEVEVTILD